MDVPSDYLYAGSMIAVVMVNGTVPLDGKNCTNLSDDIFGLSTFINIFSPVQSRTYYRCLSYAVVNFTAGLSSTYISSRIIEMDLVAAPWVHEAIYLMPDVMSTFSMMNSTPLATWENLDNYTTQLIRHSYQAPGVCCLGLLSPTQQASTLKSTSNANKRLYRTPASTPGWLSDGPIAALVMDSAAVDKKGRDLTTLAMLDSEVDKRVGKVILRHNAKSDYFLVPAENELEENDVIRWNETLTLITSFHIGPC